jgi:hypothetical protein
MREPGQGGNVTEADSKKLAYDLVAALCAGTDVDPILLNWEAMEACLWQAIEAVQITPQQEAVLRAVRESRNSGPSIMEWLPSIGCLYTLDEVLEREESQCKTGKRST